MRRLAVRYLQPGMSLAREVPLGKMAGVLPADTLLTEQHLQTLRKQGVRAVFLKDSLVDDLVISELVSAELKTSILEALRRTWETVRKTNGVGALLISPAEYSALASKLVREVRLGQDKEYCLGVSPSLAEYDYYHALNVAAIALSMGIKKRYKASMLQNLALAALLHDVGNALLPAEIFERPGELEPGEIEQVRKHPALGFSMLKRSAFDTWVYAIVGQHHERWNGTGYPSGYARDRTLEPARLLGIVEVYDALMSERPHRPAMPPHLAIEYILSQSDELFDYNLVQLLASTAPTYYAGSTVRLSTGEIGVVVRTNVGLVARPVVRVCWEGDGRQLSQPYEADMSAPPYLDLMIAEAMDH